MRVILVTGMSGAGKSTALRVFEDAGFEAIDNLPLSLLPALMESYAGMPAASEGQGVAVGVDVRNRDFSTAHFLDTIATLKAAPYVAMSILFLDCDNEVLQKRFTETRRRHPLAADRPVADGIADERRLIGGMKLYADITIDTTDMTLIDLRREVKARCIDKAKGFTLGITSFSYARGVPREADLVFDVRFLRNPHYQDSLKHLTGREAAVGAHISEDPIFAEFFAKLSEFLVLLLPRYRDEGKSYLTLAIGCTGGRHRSVFVAERLTTLLKENGYDVALRHRELAS